MTRFLLCATVLALVTSASVAVGAESEASDKLSPTEWQKHFVTCELTTYEHNYYQEKSIRKMGNLSVEQAEAALADYREALVRQLVFGKVAEELGSGTYQSVREAVDAGLYKLYQQDSEAAVQEYGRMAANCAKFYETVKERGGEFVKLDAAIRENMRQKAEMWEQARVEFVEAATKQHTKDGSPKPTN